MGVIRMRRRRPGRWCSPQNVNTVIIKGYIVEFINEQQDARDLAASLYQRGQTWEVVNTEHGYLLVTNNDQLRDNTNELPESIDFEDLGL